MKTVTIMGATGVVGQQTLDVIRRHPDEFEIHALTARSASEKLALLCSEFDPEFVLIDNPSLAQKLHEEFRFKGLRTNVLSGDDWNDNSIVSGVNIVVAAMAGSAGLRPMLEAVRAGTTVLIANKEPVVMLGPVLSEEVQNSGATILPVDSEHNAIFQCSATANGARYEPFHPIPGLRRILLTGTGGPFRNRSLESLHDVTPKQAVAHPIWNMGAKISVDSATMMNKGLEIIEAKWLFNASPQQIEVIIHPQGMVHSMVEYEDGSIIAQLAMPDMRIPIANAMFWPRRMESGAEFMDLTKLTGLQFESPDWNRFPCLRLAREVANSEGTSATVMNAANEVAVDAFLDSRVRFTDIAKTVQYCVDKLGNEKIIDVEQILEIDSIARDIAQRYVASSIN